MNSRNDELLEFRMLVMKVQEDTSTEDLMNSGRLCLSSYSSGYNVEIQIFVPTKSVHSEDQRPGCSVSTKHQHCKI